MNTIELHGCTSEPLMNYLKAVGVLRLIVEQGLDPNARGFWKHNVFCLRTKVSEVEIIEFFAKSYQPSPILSHWNEAGGFKKARGADVASIASLRNSDDPRLSKFKRAISEIDTIIRANPAIEKDDLLKASRNHLPNDFLQWFDSCAVSMTDGFSYAPYLGTGGNVGKLELPINFIKNFLLVLKNSKSAGWLRASLFDDADVKLEKTTVGQFAPGRNGGANATQGMEGQSMINPWDFIFLMEGSLLLSGTSNKKMGANGNSKAVFPFTTSPSAVGNSMLLDANPKKGRGELWLPLWERASSLGEIQILFSEARAEWRGKPVENGVDFSKAIAGLGVDRGIKSFMRYSFDEHIRAGVMATPLGQFEVAEKNDAALLREIDFWLPRFRQACGNKAPARFQTSLREIERAIFDYCQYGDTGGDKTRFQRILIALGNAERLVASAPRFRAEAKGLRPLSGLSEAWVTATDDSSPEFEIALALASIWNKEIGGIRLNLEDVVQKGSQYQWAENNHSAVWTNADLATNLSNILYRRVMNADKAGDPSFALTSSHRATLDGIGEFLAGNLDEVRIADLLWGLSLCNARKYRRPSAPNLDQPQHERLPIPAAFSLLKVMFHPAFREDIKSSRPDLGILGLLRADRMGDACQRTVRMLRGRSLRPKPFPMHGFPSRDDEWLECARSSLDSRTLAAALLIPLHDFGADSLEKQVLRDQEPSDS